MIRGLVCLCSILACAGCATNVVVPVPIAKVEAPDITGAEKIGGSLGVALAPAVGVEVVDDGETRPPDISGSYTAKGWDLQGRGDLSFLKRFQVGLQYGLPSSTFSLKGKIQILGSNLRDVKAKEFLLGAFAHIGSGSRSSSGDQQSTFGPGGYPWRATAVTGTTGVGLSAGYRFFENFSVYTGVARDWYRTRAEVVQERSATGDSAGGQYKKNYSGRSESLALGIRWGREASFSIYGALSKLSWTDLADRHDASIGLSIDLLIR